MRQTGTLGLGASGITVGGLMVDVYWRSYGSEAVYIDISGGRQLPSGNALSKFPLR